MVKTAPCGVPFCGGDNKGNEVYRCRRHMAGEGCYFGVSEQIVQHEEIRLTGEKWSRRGEKGEKDLNGQQRQTQVS